MLIEGESPPVPRAGTLEEMIDVYLGTVLLYAECEDKRRVAAEAFETE